MSSDEAKQFFGWFYHGEHHIPSTIKPFGSGWVVIHNRGDLATFDFNGLTRLVLMAHAKQIRVSIMPYNFNSFKIAIWQRKLEGAFDERHPTIETAIADFTKEIL